MATAFTITYLKAIMHTIHFAGAVSSLLFVSAASAAAIPTIYVDPINRGAIDEQPPRVAMNDAPTGFGPDSWMNAAYLDGSGNKVNAYISDDGSTSNGTPGVLPNLGLGAISVGDLESIGFYTKTPTGTDPWFLNFYTATDGSDDDASWYGERFTFTVTSDAPDANGWVWNEVTGAKYTSGSGGTYNFADFLGTFGSEGFGMISPQTNSGEDGSDAQFDGLVIGLANGSSVQVDFTAVPEPTLGLGLAGAGLLVLRRRR